jgi:hypothetical protein
MVTVQTGKEGGPVRKNPVHRPAIALLAILAFSAFSGPARAGEGVDGQLDRVMKAYGGVDALRKAASVRETGKVTSRMRGGAAGDIVREFERPDRLRVFIRYGGSDTEARVYDGKTGWREGKAVQGPPLEAMVLQAARMALPLILLDRRENLVDRGMATVDGKELRTLELPLGGGLTLTVGIDASGRIVRSSGTGGVGMAGRQLEFITRYSDYRIVDSVLRPFREENYANGFVTGETILTRVEVLDSFPAGTFRP